MNGLRIKVLLCAVWCIVSTSLLGCGNGFTLVDTGSIFQMPWYEKPDEMPGVVPPYKRMAELREMTKNGGGFDAAKQEEMSKRLAEEIRGEDDPLIRLEIVRAVSTCKTTAADAVLESALEDDSADVRIAACNAWGRRGGSGAVRLLSKTLASDTNGDVRLAATRALGETGDPAAVPGLGVALEDGDPTMQYRAVLSLKKVSREDFGNDVGLWRQYVRGENPVRPTQSLADRIRNLF